MPGVPFNRGQKKLRRGRFSETNYVYHVTSTTFRRLRLFEPFEQGRIVVNAMKREHDAGHVDSFAFVVMPDHVHWLFQLQGTRSLSTTMNTVKSFSARRINAVLGTSGRIWEPGFYDRAARIDDEISQIARYIVANPLRAGLVESIAKYPLWDCKWL